LSLKEGEIVARQTLRIALGCALIPFCIFAAGNLGLWTYDRTMDFYGWPNEYHDLRRFISALVGFSAAMVFGFFSVVYIVARVMYPKRDIIRTLSI
jgi:hypothetical protein